MPAATIASASPTVAQVTPTADSPSWRRASSGVRWVLTWGRTVFPVPRSRSDMATTLAANRSKSTTRAGVDIDAARPGLRAKAALVIGPALAFSPGSQSSADVGVERAAGRVGLEPARDA